jgi:acyl-homoserine lactone acylase PvdQ
MKSAHMKFLSTFLTLILATICFGLSTTTSQAQSFTKSEISRWQMEAKAVTIIRDNWGIPHIYGKTDANAVFGLLYAQCEDDFKRVELNYIEKLGRMAEVKGESELYNDLLIRMIIDTADAIKDYRNSPPWLKKLMNAYADGINYYLYKHPSVKPALLTRFEPWYPLLWTDGSIGAIDIADIAVDELKNFYSGDPGTTAAVLHKEYDPLPGGSNGFAIAPSKTASGNAILYINPHVTFYFRPEVAVESGEGLHAYGAVTWGQFFVYQGFNEHCGWMHTSSYSDVADSYIEKITKKEGDFFYEYDNQLKSIGKKEISIAYLSKGGKLLTKKITTYYTHHGPVMAKRNGQWISVRANNRDIKGLIQSWQRTKATGLDDYRKSMELLANTSNNTVYADDKGNIAYWHGNFMPKRDPKINWNNPVDGSTSATEWKSLHTLDELIQIHNPATGWIQNCNSTPFTASGSSSPKKENFPVYMAPSGENFRGVNAIKILESNSQYTIDKVIAAGYDPHLPAFDVLVPALLKAYGNHQTEAAYESLQEPMKLLAAWDKNTSETSIATTLAIEWGEKIWPIIQRPSGKDDTLDQVEKTHRFATNATAKFLLDPMLTALNQLTKKFGTWRMPWGDINRYQRLTGNLPEKFDDTLPSLPDGFAASTWGCLPSYVSRSFNGTNKRYGYNGNSFICAVEFGKKVKAKSLLAGGQSGDVNSKHFGDQALMYTKGQFKEVLFYKEDVLKHAERTYHPGE